MTLFAVIKRRQDPGMIYVTVIIAGTVFTARPAAASWSLLNGELGPGVEF